jgi:hypothetical protein
MHACCVDAAAAAKHPSPAEAVHCTAATTCMFVWVPLPLPNVWFGLQSCGAVLGQSTFCTFTPACLPFAPTPSVSVAQAAATPSSEHSPLILQAARNMAASHDADTASERSSVSGASRSSSMRDSHHGPHGSPAMLLRKAKAMIDRQVAVGE